MNARELSAEAAAARLAFVTAVAELRWRPAQQASVAMGPLQLTELRQDPALEMAVVDACAGGPAWLQDAMRPLLFQDVPCVTRTKERGAWREEAIRSVAAANVAWAAAERLARIGAASARHLARAYRVPIVAPAQAVLVAQAFDDLVEDVRKAEAKIPANCLADSSLLQKPDVADVIVRRGFGCLPGPGRWVRTAMEACARSPHYNDCLPAAVEQVLKNLSWPTLRCMWWVVASEPAAIPKGKEPLGPVAARWLELAAEGRVGMQES